VSKHAALVLHQTEEAVWIDIPNVLHPFPAGPDKNPIQDYFFATSRLAGKFTQPPYADDAEVIGLLLLGIVSAAEFYFRRVLGLALDVCPVCRQHAELVHVPLGSVAFFSRSGYSFAMSSFEHESLADAKKLKAECRRFTGFDITGDLSADKAIDDFELLCQLRHCLVHASGLAGFKASRALSSPRREIQKLILRKEDAFELLKLSHNAVRGFNRFLANSILNRWVDRDLLVGKWSTDKQAFTAVVKSFWMPGEDEYLGIPWNAYRPFRKAVVTRKQALAAKVATTPHN